MQAIAAELRQPETAFLWPENEATAIRWFSPEMEVDLCGHATLAAAHVLWEEGLADRRQSLVFNSRLKGAVAATSVEDGSISMNFPACFGSQQDPDPAVLACIDRTPIAAGLYANRWILEFASAEDVRELKPRFDALKATGTRSLIVTAISDHNDYDIISRNFAPIVGVNEDQVTGAAHTCLAPYWESRLGTKLRCWQASQRGGAMTTSLVADRVLLQGKATIEFGGNWRSAS
jgi:PhzF family phenazine biosynthesis protein